MLSKHQQWAVLICCLTATAVVAVQAQCAANMPFTACPTATAAAQLLTGNSLYLPVSNAAFQGKCVDANGQLGIITSFTAGCHYLSDLMPQGALVISTGRASVGARTTNTENASWDHKTSGGDQDLQSINSKIYSQPLTDEAVLTFDIVPTVSGNVYFSYAFGSEEYPEYAPGYVCPAGQGGCKTGGNTNNDVFAFFAWAGSTTRDSIALLPGTTTYVSILSVNAQPANSQYYVSNVGNTMKTEMDGMTTMLNTTTVAVTAGVKYTFKIAIGDGGTGDMDSLVWLKAGSLSFNVPVATLLAAQTSPSPTPQEFPSPGPDTSPTPSSPSPDINTTNASPSPVPTNITDASPGPAPLNSTDVSPSPAPGTNSTADNTTETSPSPSPGPNATDPSPSPDPTNTTDVSPSLSPDVSPSPSPDVSPSPSPEPDANTTSPSPSPSNTTDPSPSPNPEPPTNTTDPAGNTTTSTSPSPDPASSPTPNNATTHDTATNSTNSTSPDNTSIVSPSPEPSTSPSTSPNPSPSPDPQASPSPAVQHSSPDHSPSPSPDPPSPSPSPAAQNSSSSPSPSPSPTSSPSPNPEASPSPSPPAQASSPSPGSKPSPSPSPNGQNTSSSPAPASDTQFDEFVWSPPLDWQLPPMNESGIVLRGGNVTITGLTIDTAAVTSNTAEQEVAAAAATLRQRTAAFNGTLGFFTLGLSIEVLGEFGLKRSMAWSYNTRMECWVTQVGVAGLFRLTREELVNGLVVSNSTLEPMASGTLNMFSIVFPGPGFTGTYDWAGALNLVPDPFEIWGFNSLVSQRRLLEVSQHPAPGHSSTPAAAFWHDPNPHVRALLQAGDGRLPVHGRVSVREARSGPTVVIGDAPQPGSQAPIDDEIMAYNPIPPDPNNPAGYTWLEEHPSQGTPEPQLPQSIQDAIATIVRTFSDPDNQRTLIIVAALVAPLGLALCAVGFAAMYVRRRRQRERKSTSASTEGGTMSKRPSGMIPPNTDVYDMQPHETGYGSVCGVNQPAMLPPSCDSSADGGTSSAPMAPRSVFNTLRSSLTGMASAIGIYRGQSGDVYRVQEQRQQQNIPGGLLRGPSLDMQAQWPPQQNIPGGLLRGPSLDMQAQGWPSTLRRREPTLPGGTRRSLDAPVATAGRPAVTAALPVTGANNAAGRGAPASGPVAARLGNNAGMQMAQQRQQQQQQQQGAVMQWMPQQQGPGDAMWGTPDMQAARSGSVYNNPLAQSQSGSGAGSMEGATGFMPAGANQAIDSGFFLSGGDTLIMPSEFTLADIHDVQSQAQAAPSAPAAPSAGALRPWQRQRVQASGGAPAPFINWQ